MFGFFGVPAQVRQSVSDTVLKEHCRAQLVRLFGEQASTPKAEYLKDWAKDPLTAMPADASGNGQHVVAPPSKPKTGVWQDCLTGCGSEWSAHSLAMSLEQLMQQPSLYKAYLLPFCASSYYKSHLT
ncbi:hypothetical protein [Psychrobacter immobilis]|uniref:hypothetical protein n=1 Tax=Psychrobacter immobilis TaxID=498 RepID=UPI002234199A|nr:hypothetical protein [Psychrobacter immobilis]